MSYKPICLPVFMLSVLIFNTPAIGQRVAPQNIEVAMQVKATGKNLERDLLIELRNRKDGAPISNATIEVDVDMPSMPMMHTVPKAIAKPTATPGQYRLRVTLEMAGEWAAHIVVKEPVRVNTLRKFDVGADSESSIGQKCNIRAPPEKTFPNIYEERI